MRDALTCFARAAAVLLLAALLTGFVFWVGHANGEDALPTPARAASAFAINLAVAWLLLRRLARP